MKNTNMQAHLNEMKTKGKLKSKAMPKPKGKY